MKGEYVEEKDQHPSNMFAKFHHHSHNKLQQQQQQPPLHPHHFQLAPEYHTSEEADSRSPGGAATTPSTAPPAKKEPNSDGATIEVVRRPRGRPPGSKNKPKPPVIITRDTEPSMSPYVLELSGGVDVVDAITRFCRNRNMGLCVLTGSGTVANVTLRQPSPTPGGSVTFHGRFDILSLSATVLPPSTSSVIPPAVNGFTISLAGPQGQVVGGLVAGPLLAAAPVYIIATSFNSPSFHRLPIEEEMRNSGSGGGDENHSPPAVSGGGGEGRHPPGAEVSCGMSIYSGGHLPSSDVIWAPTARQPPPHY